MAEALLLILCSLSRLYFSVSECEGAQSFYLLFKINEQHVAQLGKNIRSKPFHLEKKIDL